MKTKWIFIQGLIVLWTLVFLLGEDKTDASSGNLILDEEAKAREFAVPRRTADVSEQIVLRQAFFGSPPLMPHKNLAQSNPAICLQCHARKNRIELRQQAIAPVPHQEYSQCLQCHVAADREEPLFVQNDFTGLTNPGKGSRSHLFAPPTVPHRLFMRDNCLSCHGVTGKSPIKSPHPVRSQCLQCHVPEISRDFSRPQQNKE